MSKKSLINKMQIVEKDDMAYAVVYAVRGCLKNQPVDTIGLYFSKDEAERTKENYYNAQIYDTIYIIEMMVWF